jgi:subtilisin family serine protease
MKQRYVLLRDLAASMGATRGHAERGDAPSADAKVVVEAVEADEHEASRLGGEAGVSVIAPAMPMCLIRPRACRAVAAAGEPPIAWGIEAVGAHTSGCDGRGIKVAVLDTGCDTLHPAFEGVRFDVRDFTGEGEGDENGHGTHCAGTFFGRTVNGMRIGVAPGVTDVLIGKVLGKQVSCTSEQIASAVFWAVERGASVVSMSLGMDFPGCVRAMVEAQGLSIELATARALEHYRANVLLFAALASMIRARRTLTVLVAAAGNESRRDERPDFDIGVSPPAVSEGIVSVAAVGISAEGWRVADFSNVGATVCGPGVDIVSAAAGGGLVAMSGTSMAAPHVAGVAALWVQSRLKGGGSVDRAVVDKLTGMASDKGFKPGFDPRAVGGGLVQAP